MHTLKTCESASEEAGNCSIHIIVLFPQIARGRSQKTERCATDNCFNVSGNGVGDTFSELSSLTEETCYSSSLPDCSNDTQVLSCKRVLRGCYQ